MAVPRVSENPTVQQQYAAQLALTGVAVAALRALWAATLPLSSPEGLARFREGVAAMVGQLSPAAASIATDYYLAARMEAGVPGTAKVPLVSSPPRSQIDAGLDWAMRAVEAQADALMAEMEAQAAELETKIQARAEAAVQKMLADIAREQVVAAVDGDDKALGFRRVPRPDACAFCIIQAIRSTSRKGLAKDFKKYAPGSMTGEKHYGIYKSRASAGASVNDKFTGGGEAKFHNNCHCVIEPVFSTVNQLPVWLHDLEVLYDDTEGGLNEFRRALKALRRGETPDPPEVPVRLPTTPPQGIELLLDRLAEATASRVA
jgi:hypothetical protein